MTTDKLLKDAWDGMLGVFSTTDPEEYSRRAPYVLYADLLPTRRIRTKAYPYGGVTRSPAPATCQEPCQLVLVDRVNTVTAMSVLMRELAKLNADREIVRVVAAVLVSDSLALFSRYFVANNNTAIHFTAKAVDDHRIMASLIIGKGAATCDAMWSRYYPATQPLE